MKKHFEEVDSKFKELEAAAKPKEPEPSAPQAASPSNPPASSMEQNMRSRVKIPVDGQDEEEEKVDPSAPKPAP